MNMMRYVPLAKYLGYRKAGAGVRRGFCLARALGDCVLPLIGLQRILFTNIFQRL